MKNMNINPKKNPKDILIELSGKKEDNYEFLDDKQKEDSLTNNTYDNPEEKDLDFNKKFFSESLTKENENVKENVNITFLEYLKQNLFTKTDIYLGIMNIIGIVFYHYGLMPCEKDPSECTIKRGMIFYVTIGILAAVSSILFSIYISITLYKKKHYLHYLYTVPAYIYFITKYKGTETIDHGFYNSLGWIIILILIVPIVLFCFFIYNLIKKKRYRFLVFIALLFISIIILYNNLPGFSCEFWDIGLNNTKINNDKDLYPCEILIPGKDKCYLKKMDGFFDFSKILRPSCSAQDILEGEKKILLNSLSDKYFGVSKLNHFGYPITTIPERYSMYSVRDLPEFQERINHNMIKMDLYNKENYPDEPYPEVELFFDENNYGRIKINVTRDEKLSKERKEISKDKHSLFNNVLIIYIDAISRNQFQRKFHKLSKYIEQYMPYNTNENEKSYSSFQFMKYNTLKGLTLPNIKSMFYGVGLDESDGINVVKFFKNQGYVTGHTGTTCGKEIFSVNGLLQSQHLDYDNWDHENIALFCDPNFFDARYPVNKGVASVLKRCLYGKYGFEYMMEYTKQFWNLYPDNKKFFRIHFNEGHEGSMELVSYLVDPILEFVKYFFDNNLLNDTFVFIVSDHGNHMVGPWAFIRPQDYILESTLATLFFIIPNNNKLYENGLYDKIHKNQQIFLTPYDIHDTMIHIAYGNDNIDPKAYSKRGSSLLIEINPMERYCENPLYNLKIAKGDCKCKLYKKK